MTSPRRPQATSVELTVDGRAVAVEVDNRALLLELLRDELDAKAPKAGCLNGDCGACTILLDGVPAKSCLELAACSSGRTVTTLEGLSGPDGLSRTQHEFARTGVVQCGFCLSGMLLVAHHLVETTPQPSEQDVRKSLEGNLCRCTGYDSIVSAVLRAVAPAGTPSAGGGEEV